MPSPPGAQPRAPCVAVASRHLRRGLPAARHARTLAAGLLATHTAAPVVAEFLFYCGRGAHSQLRRQARRSRSQSPPLPQPHPNLTPPPPHPRCARPYHAAMAAAAARHHRLRGRHRRQQCGGAGRLPPRAQPGIGRRRLVAAAGLSPEKGAASVALVDSVTAHNRSWRTVPIDAKRRRLAGPAATTRPSSQPHRWRGW